MSSSCKESDVHTLLLAAAQKDDILTYSSSHLGPSSLNWSQPPKETQQLLWSASQSQEESPNSLALKKKQTKTLACVKKKEMEASPSENTSGAAFVESEVFRSKQDQTKDYSSHAGTMGDATLTQIDSCPSDVLTNQLKDCSQTESDSLSHPKGSLQFSLSPSNNEGRLEMWVDKEVATKQDMLAERVFPEACEQKLQKELKKLSVQSRPSRDRLAVFSDVFDDVCVGSPVFGRILREIKCSQPLNDSVTDTDMKEMSEKELFDAQKEVCRLEQEAKRALEEKKRFQHELWKIPATIRLENNTKNTSLSVLQDGANVPQLRLQVLKIRKAIQDLEKEICENQVSNVKISATERRIKDVKTESMKLIASIKRLRTISKDFEGEINEVLNTK